MATYFHTEKTNYRLTLKEHMDGAPYFMLEPKDRELSIVQAPGWLGIELRPGITFKQAEEVWKTLSGIIAGVSYARPEEVPDEGGEQ